MREHYNGSGTMELKTYFFSMNKEILKALLENFPSKSNKWERSHSVIYQVVQGDITLGLPKGFQHTKNGTLFLKSIQHFNECISLIMGVKTNELHQK